LIISIEKFLYKIDTTLYDKSSRDIQMIYIMIFTAILSLSYLQLWEKSFEQFEIKQANIESLQNKINLDTIYLKVNPTTKLLKLKNDIKLLNNEIISYKDKNEFIKNKIEAISSLIYDEIAWGEYLYSVSANAKKYNVDILYFTNYFADNNNSFGHILDISIQSSSNFKNSIKFINSLEQSNLVVDIHTLNIQAKDKLFTDLNLSVWGIAY